MKRGKACASHGAGSPITAFHCPEASSRVRGLFFPRSSQVECLEKGMKDKHQPSLAPFNRRFNWYRSEVNLQCLSRLSACDGFMVLQYNCSAFERKEVFAVTFLEWDFQKYSVVNPFSHDSTSHCLFTNHSEKRKLRVHWGSLNSQNLNIYC